MAFGRSEARFWRFVGIIAICVCSLNLLTTFRGPQKMTDFQNVQSEETVTTPVKHQSDTQKEEEEEEEETDRQHEKSSEISSFYAKDNIFDEIRRTKKMEESMRKNPPKIIRSIRGNVNAADIAKSMKKPVWLSVRDLDKYFLPRHLLMLGRKRTSKGFIVFGLPTVHRKKAYYLKDTINYLLKPLSPEEKAQVIIVIFVADFDENYQQKVVADIKKNFKEDVESGVIQVIKAPESYYPNLATLPLLYGDKPNRVQWRSKQSLDYSFLYFYCADLAQYYIQLEDDILTEPGYFIKIKNYIEKKNNEGDWSILEFGTRGFIGMTYKAENLLQLARFTRFYFWTMPVDWLFRIFNDIFLVGNEKRNVISPPVFKHVGAYSSLDGQRRKLEDLRGSRPERSFRRYQSKKGNPLAKVTTNIDNFVLPHSVNLPYGTSGLFWAKEVNQGDYVDIVFEKEFSIKKIVIDSGSAKHPDDALKDTELYVGYANDSCAQFEAAKKFKNKPLIEHTFSELEEPVKCVRLRIDTVRKDDSNRKRWLIIREIAIF